MIGINLLKKLKTNLIKFKALKSNKKKHTQKKNKPNWQKFYLSVLKVIALRKKGLLSVGKVSMWSKYRS
jgi:hypothetical protein